MTNDQEGVGLSCCDACIRRVTLFQHVHTHGLLYNRCNFRPHLHAGAENTSIRIPRPEDGISLLSAKDALENLRALPALQEALVIWE